MLMDPAELIRFLKENIEPLEDNVFGPGYRASVFLTDGTFLPCVIFRNPKTVVDLAIRRFKEEQSGKGILGSMGGYDYIVKAFVTQRNRIDENDIERVQQSEFAFPLNILRQIHGETTMGWTGFAAKMKDGKYFGFGTSFHSEFFQMPDGYSDEDISEIVNHSFVLKSGELRSHRIGGVPPSEYKEAVVYRERPFFECFIDHL